MPVIGTKGAELDLLIRQGATFGPNVSTLTNPNASPMNLTGGTFRAQIRKTATSTLVPGAVASFTITAPALGQFEWQFPASVTELLTAANTDENDAQSKYVWDMEFEDSAGRVIPLLYGQVFVFREVTKDEP